MLVTLLPLILAAGLLAAVATGALPFDQGVLGLLLLLCPGADRFLPLLRVVLGRGAAPAGMPAVDEDDALEHVYWAFDAERKRSGDERLLWKGYMRAAFHGQLGLPPAPKPGAPVLVGATDALRSADRAEDNRRPPTPIPGIGRLTRVPILLLLPLLALASCANIERRNAAREVFMQAQEQQTAALRELQTLSATHQAALLRLPAGPGAVKAVADFRARRKQTVDIASKAAEAARAAQVELGLRGPPEALEALARAAGAAAGALADDLAALKRYAAQQLATLGGGQ